jgi:hypothetical protein
VTAVSRIGKSFATVEAIIGQFYIAVVISQLVGLRILHATAEPAPPNADGQRAADDAESA